MNLKHAYPVGVAIIFIWIGVSSYSGNWASFDVRGGWYLYNDSRLFWDDARASCLSIGADLISIHSQAENDFVYENITRNWIAIGATDAAEEGTFLWTDGSPMDYTDWQSGEPNNARGVEDCVFMQPSDKEKGWIREPSDKRMGWNDGRCSSDMTAAFICYQEVSSYSGNWASFDVRGGWYLYNDSRLFWDDARASCLSIGADLISIHSQAENDFVYENITRNWIAIGATDAAEEGTFLWTDGSPMDYTDWQSGEPNNARGVEDCVFMQPSDKEKGWIREPSDKRMGWNDGRCSSDMTAAFICYQEVSSYSGNWASFDVRGGWYLYNDSRLFWDDARASCLSIGADLISIHSQAENDFVYENITRNWIAIGATDAAEEGTFLWTDGSPMDYTDWQSGEPNNARGVEDCVFMQPSDKEKGWIREPSDKRMGWNDGRCSSDMTAAFICYQEVSSYSGNWASFDVRGGWYLYNDSRLFWDDARASCLSIGADLISIHSQAENDFVYENITRNWIAIGATDAAEEGTFLWTDGSPMDYTDWQSGEPNNARGVEDCVFMQPSDKEKGWIREPSDKRMGWNDGPCSSDMTAAFICYQEVSSYSGNWASFDVRGGWYLYNDSRLFWDDARASCLSIGADLISIHSQAENDFVYENITRNWIAIGATDAAEEGTFLWTDGSPMDYTDWQSGEPNNARGVEDCVFMQPSDKEKGWIREPSDKRMGWNDGPCSSDMTAAFICYQEVSSYSGKWASFDVRGGWYLYNDSRLFWDDARASCLSIGADLISIHSQAENDFVYENITRNWIAIGATDAAEEGTFLWTDGSPMDYTNWQRGDPNNARGVEDCVFMQPSDKRMGWNDGLCSSDMTAAFICYQEGNTCIIFRKYMCRHVQPINIINTDLVTWL
ncbi:C-type mannose receptor 2-like isoform X2 [Haliotis rufescens]|uniref:C-type mannose receptor 2-like isoform X2 n=1 Tax=Haliotis rufescens TaxID=6454 RepID=UPI00201F01AC|nr:C-type mannose receptor 2-like isoform X2 [Haliotis rufescens]